MSESSLLIKDGTVFIVIDVQERLFAKIDGKEQLAENICKLLQFAEILEIPVIATEQYPKGLGPTIPEIRKFLRVKPIEKIEFSCMASSGFRRRLFETNAENLVLTGIETHICVAQTAIEALKNGYKVYVVYDAVSSRRREDKLIAIERMKQHGALIVTTEMVMYEILRRAGTEEFKKVLELVK
ncbi:hydrolase [Candidatus Bathyarchaeota archaeon]|nr:MAG: hydrolase [Candidatus Bathyarchaeota archaeon]